MRKRLDDVIVCSIVINALGHAGKWALALELFSSMEKVDVVSCTSAMRSCGPLGQWQRALDIM
eukprot:CAMPEP_0194483692 /NCGR_PEP_ID=MMETSP0253-20130528/5225_1 /TAXON_ID=2966 /ORGANISM="Noctiluca scintillans" /LENGTH=62 /DNA_ID=CAMNT_0039323371 /DNA_START=33 /DNA_END=218 /DNA_ORIENTATION=+